MKQFFYRLMMLIASITIGLSNLWSQDFVLDSFEYTRDLVPEEIRLDGNDEATALIMVDLAVKNVVFDGFLRGDVENRDGIYYVYVIDGEKQITIKHEDFFPLTAKFNAVRGGKCYKMRVSSNTVQASQLSVVESTETLDLKNLQVDDMTLDRWYRVAVTEFSDKDYENAFVQFKKVAAYNHPKALNALGFCYEVGYGTEIDYSKALDCYKRCSMLNPVLGYESLGDFYFDYEDKNPLQDLVKGLEYYEKAVQYGNKDVKSDLPDYYGIIGEAALHGRHGVKEHWPTAYQYFKKGAELGDSYCQYYLGFVYENGFGITENKQEARRWYQKAAAQGDEDAIQALKEMSK